jgi:hypothetical protein
MMTNKTKYITIYYTGKHKAHPLFSITRKLPHPNMQPRNELSIYILRHRFVLTWGEV